MVSTTTIKCMGRTYRATATTPGTLIICDVTDITRPQTLGSAHRPADHGTTGGDWEIHSPAGHPIAHTSELITAMATLGEHTRRLWGSSSRRRQARESRNRPQP